MENKNEVRGYKVFNPDWTCRGYQFEVGKTFEENVEPKCCNRGFHFCMKASNCFDYYDFDSRNKVAEVVALGDVDYKLDDTKACTNKIMIAREIPWDEVLHIVNTGKDCTGLCNTGNRNTGNRNTGDCNTGNWNTGDCNTGNFNTGDCNTGNWNTGNWNTGNWNTGDRNTGNCNTGNRNTGNFNTGDRNTGNCNTGNRNTGDWNTGNFNTGDWNTGNYNTGCFMTEEQKIMFFNKPSDRTYKDWLRSDARDLLNQIPKNVVEWIYSEDMTDEEKAEHPTYETTGGYLKELDESDCGQLWWDSLSDRQKNIIKALPGFDSEIFEQCTGIKVKQERE